MCGNGVMIGMIKITIKIVTYLIHKVQLEEKIKLQEVHLGIIKQIIVELWQDLAILLRIAFLILGLDFVN